MKHAFLCGVLLFAAGRVNAQTEFNHSGGGSYIVVPYSISVVEDGIDYSGTVVAGYPGLTYNPRLDFVIDRNLSFSLTTYATMALNITVNSREGSSGFFAVQAPLLGQLNFGHHATQRTRSGFGGFVAAGYDFGFYSGGIGVLHGPTVQAGMKFNFRQESYGIRFEYTKPIGLSKGEKAHVFGIGFLYNFSGGEGKIHYRPGR
jgi:hypothetical protein